MQFWKRSQHNQLIKVIKLRQNVQQLNQRKRQFHIKDQMQNQPNDINDQIDRILSSNIREQLLSGIPIDLLQSPVITKTQPKYQPQSSGNLSEKKAQFEEDLYEKAQQIFKLKQVLESELANINQIVMDNQKLTEANENLKYELKNIKNQWKQFRQSINHQLQTQIQQLKQFQVQQIELISHQILGSKTCARSNKMAIRQCGQIIAKSVELLKNQSFKSTQLQMCPFSVQIVIKPFKNVSSKKFTENQTQTQSNFYTFKSIENLQVEVARLNQAIKELQTQNILYIETIKHLQQQQIISNRKSQNNPQALQQKQLNHQQKSVEKYSSIFMKSIFEQDQDIDQSIRKALFASQKSIFDQLQQGKYFGKIVSRTKNGNAIEQYKNGFQYEGKFLKNQRHGLGKLFYKKKLIYAGEWKKGKFQGKGIMFYYLNLNVQKIQANFKNGAIDGFGTLTFKSGEKIRAHFKNNIISHEAMILIRQNQNSQRQRNKSILGNVQFINSNKNKENAVDYDKILFKDRSGQFVRIN